MTIEQVQETLELEKDLTKRLERLSRVLSTTGTDDSVKWFGVIPYVDNCAETIDGDIEMECFRAAAQDARNKVKSRLEDVRTQIAGWK
jgi:hypothetical protein